MIETLTCPVDVMQEKVNERMLSLKSEGHSIFDINVALDFDTLECSISLYCNPSTHMYANKSIQSRSLIIVDGIDSDRFRQRFNAVSFTNLDILTVDIESNVAKYKIARDLMKEYKNKGFFERLSTKRPEKTEFKMQVTLSFATEAVKAKNQTGITVVSPLHRAN